MRWMLCLCFVVFHFFAQADPSICLNMIVKNESKVIRRALDSVKEWIDYWVIVDTGSTDGTQDIIKEHMKDIPGRLEERPWKNFAHNRNEALEMAKECADYVLFLDADDWFAFESDFKFPELSADAYVVPWCFTGFSYLKPQMVKTTAPWRWVGVLHEYLTCDTPFSAVQLNQMKYMIGRDGTRSEDPEKYHRAAQIFEEALKDEPDNERYVFYLAESLRDAGKKEEAIQHYLKRVAMGRWDEEVFWSLFQVAQLKNALNYPPEEIIQSYFKAHCFRPHRAEPVYYLANFFNKQGKYALAYSILKGFDSIPQPKTKDVLFTVDWIQEYGLNFELSLSAYYIGYIEEFAQLCKQLSANENLSEYFRNSVEDNKRFIPGYS